MATTTTRYQRTYSPVDGSLVATRELASGHAVERALAAAEAAQAAWGETALEWRVAVVERMVDALLARTDAIAGELAMQMGRPVRDGPKEIRGGYAERALAMAELAPETLADVDVGGAAGARRILRRRPVGVVLVLAPWNYPFLTAVNAVVPAILAGNAVVLKHSDQTPLASERIAEAFATAGLPDGVLQVLHMNHDTVADVIRDERIGYVHFTGSVEGGRAVKRAAAERFIGVGLELGGKDPAYVRADADLDQAAAGLVDGAMFNAGQSCCGIERIYVQRERFDPFVERFLELARAYRLGDPRDPETTLGPMVRTASAELARDHVRDAVARGAVPLIDPKDFPAAAEGTAYMAPQVLINVRQNMRVMQEETFGPVVGIMPVADDDEAVRLMNDSRYGLTASVWTADVAAADRLGSRLATGTCYANRCDYLDPLLPWSGVKDSGHGVSLSRLGFEPFTRTLALHLKAPG
ncbi:MAG TPA: aldehyde dehydrogenase family protein [Trueperaceae bacterium]|nr:aldehyde dehydrogenase family protein [Trueperaceae bacterium]